MEKYPTGMLLNTSTNRYHPIAFRLAPGPGGVYNTNEFSRYRSLGHHTDGFDTIEEAIKDIKSNDAMEWIDLHWEWDGVDIPAIVTFLAHPIKHKGTR